MDHWFPRWIMRIVTVLLIIWVIFATLSHLYPYEMWMWVSFTLFDALFFSGSETGWLLLSGVVVAITVGSIVGNNVVAFVYSQHIHTSDKKFMFIMTCLSILLLMCTAFSLFYNAPLGEPLRLVIP